MDVVLEHEHYYWQRGKDQGRSRKGSYFICWLFALLVALFSSESVLLWLSKYV